MNPDRPVTTIKEDGFNYNPLAEQLAPHLILKPDDSSLVAGVEAPWGSGKTSFLNLTRQAIKKIGPDVVVLDYCPWVYSTADSLILGFCIQLASQFQISDNKKFTEISLALVGFSAAIKPFSLIPGIAPIASTIGALMDNTAKVVNSAAELSKFDISNAKAKVQEALKDTGKSVIIFVDDVDRLQPQEVRLLFQFLKAVADFNGVSYVLAYDPIPVEKALSHNDSLDGKEYLKKFVQLPIRLPRLSRTLMRRFLSETVDHLSSECKPIIQGNQLQEIRSCAMSDLVMQCLKTPRDTVRCFNLFRLRYPDCCGELNLGDLLKFVLLDILCPEAIELVRKSPELYIGLNNTNSEFAGNYGSLIDSLYSGKNDNATKRKLHIESLPNTYKEIAAQLLNSLFPSHQGMVDVDVRAASSVSGLIKLLYGGTSSMAFSVKEAEAFLSGERRFEIINDKLKDEALKEWIYFLSSVTSTSQVSDPIDIADHFIKLTKQCTSGDFLLDQAEWYVSEYLTVLLGKITDPEEAFIYIESIISHSEFLLVSHNVLIEVTQGVGLWESGISYPIDQARTVHRQKHNIPPNKVLELEAIWLGKVRACAARNELHEQKGLGNILFRWGQFPDNDYSEPQKYIQNFCKNNDPLILLSNIKIGDDVYWMNKLFSSYDDILTSLGLYTAEPELRQRVINLIKHQQTQSSVSVTESVSE